MRLHPIGTAGVFRPSHNRRRAGLSLSGRRAPARSALFYPEAVSGK